MTKEQEAELARAVATQEIIKRAIDVDALGSQAIPALKRAVAQFKEVAEKYKDIE